MVNGHWSRSFQIISEYEGNIHKQKIEKPETQNGLWGICGNRTLVICPPTPVTQCSMRSLREYARPPPRTSTKILEIVCVLRRSVDRTIPHTPFYQVSCLVEDMSMSIGLHSVEIGRLNQARQVSIMWEWVCMLRLPPDICSVCNPIRMVKFVFFSVRRRFLGCPRISICHCYFAYPLKGHAQGGHETCWFLTPDCAGLLFLYALKKIKIFAQKANEAHTTIKNTNFYIYFFPGISAQITWFSIEDSVGLGVKQFEIYYSFSRQTGEAYEMTATRFPIHLSKQWAYCIHFHDRCTFFPASLAPQLWADL